MHKSIQAQIIISFFFKCDCKEEKHPRTVYVLSHLAMRLNHDSRIRIPHQFLLLSLIKLLAALVPKAKDTQRHVATANYVCMYADMMTQLWSDNLTGSAYIPFLS